MRRIVFFLFVLELTLCSTGLQGQADGMLPKLYHSSISLFDINNGLPIPCASGGLMDRNGRLWINPCFSQEEHQTINFYRFDGEHADFIEWEGIPPGIRGQAVLSGFNQEGALFGFFRNTGTCFFFNPETRKSQYYTIDSAETRINFIGATKEHGLILQAISPLYHLVYRLRGDRLEQLAAVPRQDPNNPYYPPGWQGYTLLTDSDLWITNIKILNSPDQATQTEQLDALIRIQLANSKVREYTLNELFQGPPPPPLQQGFDQAICQGQKGTIIVHLNAWKQYFVIDLADETIRSIDPFAQVELPQALSDGTNLLSDVRMIKDSVGNILFLAHYGFEYRAVLQNLNGSYYDYTPVVKAAQDTTWVPHYLIQNAQSRDFRKRTLFFTSTGLVVVELKLARSIETYLRQFNTRAIVEAAPRDYITNVHNTPLICNFDTNSGDLEQTGNYLTLNCLGPGPETISLRYPANMVRDKNGSVWAPYDQQFIRFQSNGNCTRYFVGKQFVKFAFLDTATIALVGDNQLYLYHIPSQKRRAVLVNNRPVIFKDVVNQVYVSRDGLIWIAALDGLHKVNLKTGTYRLIGRADGFQNHRMMCLEEDEQSRLWIGSYGGGLYIYNPQTEALYNLDKKKGLSNNIVVGILTDNLGVRWLSTYSGITLVTADGEVFCRLYTEDGLSTNEFNRYSYLKGQSGELLFGSIKGINVLQPEGIKAQLEELGSPQVYLTRLTYFDTDRDSLVNRLYWPFTVETIKLPASHRSIRLQFALSSLLRKAENNFAYKLEGPDIKNTADWIYIGTNNQLNLQNLPPGKYNILIRGCDYRGNWTASPLIIPIEAADFFYKQIWFILLSIGTILALVFAWMYQQRLGRKQLKQELQHRTSEIMRTRDQLVAQEKLASLGQLTAGIAHEIKNPLNFVNNFALDSSKLADRFLAELEKVKAEMEPDRYKRIVHYLEEMKQNAQDINSSGSTADRIVRSMMDHARGTSDKRQLLDLNHLIEENVHLAISGFKAGHSDFVIDLDESYDPKMPRLYASPQNLGRAVLNILNNACYALHEKQHQDEQFKPQLWVHTATEKEHAVIRIRDNGPGIEPDIVQEIFTPFFTTKPTGAGNTGLGLSICHDIIVSEHGGQIQVRSEPGAFTEFVLKLPVSMEKAT
ncbi:MAG: hypothetical protein EP344_07690 [Bacteroidetes bacterium]|nr:MAG: hypothetical protein EP344_07690 [Bacteroidota bacterium]